MAAHSGGTDWSSVVKPLLSSNYGNLNKTDIVNIIKAIIRCENDFFDNESNYGQFFTAFSALAADTISGQCNLVCQTQVPQIIEASSILIRFILNKLNKLSVYEIKWLLPPLKSLCDGKQQTTNIFDPTVVTSILKSTKYPDVSKSIVSGSSDKESPKMEVKRSRSDLSSVILQQLTAPLEVGNPNTWAPLSEELTDCTEIFSSANISYLQSLNAGDVILDVCTSLPILTRYRLKYEESINNGRPLYLPLTQVEATQIKNTLVHMGADISILWQALTLPILEPLSPARITQLSQCAISALYCAVLTSISCSVLSMSTLASQKGQQQSVSSLSQANKEADETEENARQIVDKALEIYTNIGDMFRNSARTHVYQNHLCFGAWVLITGIQGALGASGSTGSKQQTQTIVDDMKGKSPARVVVASGSSGTGTSGAEQQTPSARVNLFKVQQGFGVLNAAIASHSLNLLTELIEDLKIEATCGESFTSNQIPIPEPANFDILEPYSSLQRVIRVLNTATLQQLLTFLATVSYRKACSLKRANAKDRTECDPISYSDSTTYFNDTISCSDNSEEDDSESYLGLWFKETLSPEITEETTETPPVEKTNETPKSNLVPVKDEPHEYLDLAAQIFCFLDQSLGTKHPYLNKYVMSGLSEQQMVLLANILKDLDRDASRGETENSACAQWQTAMIKFSGAVGRYLHNLISGSLLNESLQSNLLLHLSVSPWSQDSNTWPLQVYSSTLSVLVQILLLKPTQEKEAACLSVWHRLVNTLVEGVCATHPSPPQASSTSGGAASATVADSDYEDLNVEHAQLLLFLFHSLNLMQKKSILLLTAGGVIRCAEVCRSVSTEKPLRNNQIMLLSRLLLFLEYLMKHLYNAPTALLEQVRWNLFSVSTLDGNQKVSDLLNNKTKMLLFCRKDIEEKFRKFSSEYSISIRPKFYSLALADSKVQQEFKLDGLAWNFILCTPDKLKYPLLVDALIDILSVTDICISTKVTSHTLCAVQYCFGVCWKLLLGLPPSTPHVEALLQDKVPTLHSLLWSIRCPTTSSHYLIANSLIKQGMYTQYAETLWSNVTEHVSDMRYSLKQTILGLEMFNKTFNAQSPRISKVILLDALMAHLHAISWADKEGIQQPKATASGQQTTSPSSASSSPNADQTMSIAEEADTDNAQSDSEKKTESSSSTVGSREQLSKDVILKLLDTIKILSDAVYKAMVKNISGTIPTNVFDLLIPIASSKNSHTTEISTQFLNLISGQDKDAISVEWAKCLQVAEDSFSGTVYPVEVHTLTVIDAHLSELSKHTNYSVLLSLKHALKTLLNLINYLLPVAKSEPEIEERLKPTLTAMLFDIRMEYMYDITEKCLDSVVKADASSDAQQFLAYSHLLKYSYNVLLEYAKESQEDIQQSALNLSESMFLAVLKVMQQMLDKPMGMKAMCEFFKVTNSGSLVELLLSFTGTSLSQNYATKILQFFEKLFQAADKTDSQFPVADVMHCISDLANVDVTRLKNWLSHIILGPCGSTCPPAATSAGSVAGGVGTSTIGVQPSSTSSSNAQTPTNMATVSQLASISDQIAALDAEAMEIDEDGGVFAGVGVANNLPATIASSFVSAWQSAGGAGGSSYFTNRSDSPSNVEENQAAERNGKLLQSITRYIVQDGKTPPAVSLALFHSLLQLGQTLLVPTQETSSDFADLLQVMITLADAAQGRGHSTLFSAAIVWLEVSKFHVLEKTIVVAKNQTIMRPQIDNVTALLRYMGDLLHGLGYKGSRSLTPPWEEDMQADFEDLMDELGGGGCGGGADGDDDSIVEDSDEDSLGNKLCTFSQTQKEFMNQHWYHCHTCNMVNTVGVCSVCARVCHKNHDVSYAKYGNFFCDCGAKEDGTCQALSRRVNNECGVGSNRTASSAQSGQNVDSSADKTSYGLNRKRAQTPPSHIAAGSSFASFGSTTSTSSRFSGLFESSASSNERAMHLAKIIESSKDVLQNQEQWSTVLRCILDFFDVLMPSIRENCALFSPVGCHRRARNALERLHTPDQTFQISDQIMVPTLGSQEGAFENVRMSYSGDQGQTIKQLLSSGLVRRVALCCLSSPHGKRQHLAVSHEKGKVTILQLSALLKQADAAKRKLTLTQLSSAPIPCTVLSLTANPANEDCLAVCGLKECHILTFSSSGTANEHIVLTPQLENGNFIKKAIWLPGSQTMLALVTADYVKIYELAEDTYCPKYYFLVAVGKIRDCTFVYQDGVHYMFLIASSGYIYYQTLDDVSLAKHGDFYVTNTLDLQHPHIKDINGQVGGGGVSIYYSHTLQLLFFSYSLGRSFIAPLTDVNAGVRCVMQLQTGPPNSKNSSKGPPQPLCQWTEIAGHPGLICAMMHTSNNPVIFMLTPERITMQEIKAQSSKSKIMDMVAIRHTVSGAEKTTLILLCEDGSLRIFTAQAENTNYWLSPEVQPIGNQMYSTTLSAKSACGSSSASRKSKKLNGGKSNSSASNQKPLGPNGQPQFPIDFFEHCTILPDVEFGGNDLLQIYNKQKLKTRLFSTGMFVASTKANGFTLEITNSDSNTVIVGIRVHLGTQDILRAPQSVTVLGRTVPTFVLRARWFDIPLTKEEILQSDKRLNVVFGRSQDPENVTMLDSIEVYGKSKDLVGWPEDTDETATTTSGTNTAATTAGSGGGNAGNGNGAATGTATVGGGGTTSATAQTTAASAGTGGGGESSSSQAVTNLDKMVTSLLEVLDSGLSLLGGVNVESVLKQKAVTVASTLLLMPTPHPVQIQSKCVLATLYGNRTAYHAYKDIEILSDVNNELKIKKLQLMRPEATCEIDPEAFYRLVLLTRGIAVARPQALTKICVDNEFTILPNLLELTRALYKITPRIDEPTSIVKRGLCHTEAIIHCLVEIIYAFALSDSLQVEQMAKYLMELLLDESSVISHSAKEAIILLLSPRVKRRKVVIVSPPVCSTPTPVLMTAATTSLAAGIPSISAAVGSNDPSRAAAEEASGSSSSGNAATSSSSAVAAAARSPAQEYVVDVDAIIEPLGLGPGHPMGNFEAFLGAGGFPQLLSLQQDADDEAIMDIAIALSLQQHDGDMQSLQQGLANLQGIRNASNALQNLQAADAANTSAGGSDDEGSNAATDGSTLRTSPAEPAGSGGSESGGSGVESIGGTSGRSSTYGDQPTSSSPPRACSSGVELQPLIVEDVVMTSQAASTSAAAADARMTTITNTPADADNVNIAEGENSTRLHDLRCAILAKIVENLSALDTCSGAQSIPLFQVILILTTDLNGNLESDQQLLTQLLTALVDRLAINPASLASKLTQRTPTTEVKLILLCLFGVLMGKPKSSSSKHAGTTSPPHQFRDNASFVAATTANILIKSGAIPFCLVIMESFLSHWKNISGDNALMASGGQSGSGTPMGGTSTSAGTSSALTPNQNNLLKPINYGPKPDISALIPHNYLKNYPDIFEGYNALLTETAVRLPYQILKLSAEHPATYDWYHKFCENMTFTLCEYMMLNLNPLLRRQVRKLLMYICGNKEKFRMFRDGHSLDVHINAIKKFCDLQTSKNIGNSNQPILTYDALVELTEHLRACQEISQIRTGNWQKFCVVHEDVIPTLVQISCYQLDDGVSPIILQLLQAALCNNNQAAKQQESSSKTAAVTSSSSSSASASTKTRSERDKSEDEITTDSKFDPSHCSTFVHQIFRFVPKSLFLKFIKIFLLETNITSIRWQTHSLIYAIYENSNDHQKEKLINILWNMWPLLPAYGRRTAQFVDILGYLTLSTKSVVEYYTGKVVEVLQQQNELLSKHPNAPIYTTLEQVLQVNGYYLESEPCLVCNNPEVQMTNVKLPSIKSDSKFTTTTMIVKLVQSHTISKIILRIADLKRTKMVRTINIYYNNRTVQAVVELKNRPAMWHKARSITLQSGQTEVKIDFPLPITACNLMVEYADFYETVTGSSENLQCPRCSAAVPAYPGVCANCGENVFQCHKCRAINYDEKDPFLCHSCGFCKYAKFDFSIYGRACCAVDPIESAEDRAKTVQIIHSSLERADRIYRQLQTNKQMLELLIQKVAEHRSSDRMVDDNLGTVHSTSQVNKIIQLLAQKYCVESRTSFEELSKVVQKVKACRRELVAYDRSQMDQLNCPQTAESREAIAINRCYGCALASTEQCLTLLRAMASNYDCRIGLYLQGLVEELAQNNLRRGTPQIQDEVRNLLVLLTKNNTAACLNLVELINERVKTALSGAIPSANLDTAIHHEMTLLEALIAQDDFCWEQKLKVVFELFLLGCSASRGPANAVIQPCLRIMQALMCLPQPTSKLHKDMSPQDLSTLTSVDGLTVDYRKWLDDDKNHSFDAWKARMPPNLNTNTGGAKPKKNVLAEEKLLVAEEKLLVAEEKLMLDQEKFKLLTSMGETLPTTTGRRGRRNSARRSLFARPRYLREKYGRRWRNYVLYKGQPNPTPLQLNASWLQPILFNANSRFGRQLACALITSLSRTHERKREILNLLTDFLKYVGEAGEASAEFLTLYRTLASDSPWRQYLALKGVLTQITQLLAAEIVNIHRLEETTLSSDLAQGYALRQFVDLLTMFIVIPAIRQAYKTRLLGPVLEGYLSLRKLVVQRARLIDDAQEKLLEMLEEMTSGTEEETRAFMEILIDTVEKTRLNDIKTPVFIFERLYSIIHPEENDESEFFLTLEKDPQQEDFLQGRMLGNPYPSTEAGLGPLMRDVKNKICTDCELIALLEDDNGMELLVNNKIISLDLPVKDVYKKVWLAEGGERDAMRVVYRMRGLLGDATEEFVETLNNKSQEEVDTEQLYRMANVLADCNGLKVMLDRISSLQNISRTRELIQVLLKLFLICVKVRRCQEVLCQPELGAINTLLKVLQMCLQSENDIPIQSTVTEQLLDIMETILSKAASDTLDSFLQFSLTFGGPEYVTALISCTNCANVRNNPSVLRHLIRVLAALVYGNEVKMALLCEHFKVTLDFNKFDGERTTEDEFKMELFCVLTNQIEHNSIGGTLKDYIIGLGIVEQAIEYITSYAPCVKPTLLRTDSDELKEFISRPSLKYILRFLTGLATKHEATQIAVSNDIIPIIHRLEQVSSDEHVGSLAENLLEALCTDTATASRVQEVRDFTRTEKKRLAMATREKQLDALGMRTNDKGQVTAKGSILQKIEKLRDETGLTCFICREGYACQPAKVLGIYTFTKRTNVEEFELKTRKTVGYTTVTHFNVVHVDCHTSAIRLARGRDEWERASLQNANTRCNGLLPLWGPEVSESAFSACMTRHSSYMQESTQRCEIFFTSSIHDLKLLLIRFGWEKSFHDDAGGGGPQSNMHFVPYLLFYAVYLLLSSRSAAREEKTLLAFLTAAPSEKWLECAYDVEGPLYLLTLSLALHSPDTWNKHKVAHLKRLIAAAQARHVSPSVLCKALLSANDRQAREYSVYKPFFMMWALVDLIHNVLFKNVTTPKEEDWSISLFDYIRKNDEAMLKATDSILQVFTEEYLPCTSFGEFCDVAGLLHLIENPEQFINDVLLSMPSTSSA